MTRTAGLLALALLAACGDNLPESEVGDAGPPDGRPLGHIELHVDGQPGKPHVLIYTFENFWRHASNLDCRGQIVNMYSTRGFDITTTNDPLAINATNLKGIDVLVLAITSGDGLNSLGRADLEAWIRGGGGVVGFHSATMTEPSWPFYNSEVTGTRFAGHVNGIYEATVRMTSPTHPITAGLPDLTFSDEWYMFTQRPETITGATPLMTLDEDTLPADYPAMYKQGVHTIAWARETGPSRMFYAAWGHMPTTWYDPTIIELTGRAIEWAAHQR